MGTFALTYKMIEVKKLVTVYAESTPNPAAMKFVANSFLLKEGSVEYLNVEEAKNSPLAQQLFSFDGVVSVFIASNFITVNKKQQYDWFDLMPILREFIKGFLESGEKIFIGPSGQKADEKIEKTITSNKIESKIIEMLDGPNSIKFIEKTKEMSLIARKFCGGISRAAEICEFSAEIPSIWISNKNRPHSLSLRKSLIAFDIEMNWWQRRSLDVIGVLIGSGIVILLIVIVLCRCLFRCFCWCCCSKRQNQPKSKKD